MTWAQVQPFRRDLRKRAMIEKSLTGELIARVEPSILRSVKTDYDPRIAQLQGEIGACKGRIAQREIQLKDLETMDHAGLRSALESLSDATPVVQSLLEKEDLTKNRPQVRAQISRATGIDQTVITRLEPELASLKSKRDAELAERASALKQLDAQTQQQDAVRQSDRAAEQRRQDLARAEKAVLEERRLATLEEEARKARELEKEKQAKVTKLEAERAEAEMLRGVFLNPSPLKIAVLTPVQKKKLEVIRLLNSVAIVKAEARCEASELARVKIEIHDEKQRLAKVDEEDSAALSELRKKNKELSEVCGVLLTDLEIQLQRLEKAKLAVEQAAAKK